MSAHRRRVRRARRARRSSPAARLAIAGRATAAALAALSLLGAGTVMTSPTSVVALDGLVRHATGVRGVPAAVTTSPGPGTGTGTGTGTGGGTTGATTTDTIRARQWPLTTLHASHAWKYTRGGGITVAVLDTGVDPRQADLAGRVITGPDYTDGTRKPGGKYWGRHGTAVASLIAGHGHGPGAASGVIGVAPLAHILSIRVTWENDDPERSGKTDLNRNGDAVARGIRYAVDHGADVINMSLGGGRFDYYGNSTDEQAVKYALGKGVVLIASMGNDGAAANRRNFPAAYQGVIAVGAVDRTLRPWKDSNHHDYVSVAAPGVDIVSADVGTGYVVSSGTSTSAAFVAGAAALIRARYPKLTPQEVKQALEQGISHPPAGGRDSRIGAGIVDAYGSIKAAARLNKASHGSDGGTAPSTAAAKRQPAAAAHGFGSDALLIGILSGGGLLVIIGLIMGWRQRRRPAEDDTPVRSPEQPHPAAPVPAQASNPQTSPPQHSSLQHPTPQASIPQASIPQASAAPVSAETSGARRARRQPAPAVAVPAVAAPRSPVSGAYGPSGESIRVGNPPGDPAPPSHGLTLTGQGGVPSGGTPTAATGRPAAGFDDDPLGSILDSGPTLRPGPADDESTPLEEESRRSLASARDLDEPAAPRRGRRARPEALTAPTPVVAPPVEKEPSATTGAPGQDVGQDDRPTAALRLVDPAAAGTPAVDEPAAVEDEDYRPPWW